MMVTLVRAYLHTLLAFNRTTIIIMELSANHIVSKVPVKTSPIIQGVANSDTISGMDQALHDNTHGPISLDMTHALYATLMATPYMIPIDPGILPQIPHAIKPPPQFKNRSSDKITSEPPPA